MKHANAIKKTAKRMGVQQKIDKLYGDTIEFVDYKYSNIRILFDRLEEKINLILTEDVTNEENINRMCEIYIAIDFALKNLFDLCEVIDEQFDKEMKDIMQIYVNACSVFSNSKTEVMQNAFCFLFNFRKSFVSWAEDIIFENAEKLDNRHEEMRPSLDYIFDKIRENENEEENEIINKTKKLYVSKSRELEQMCIENGYEFKSQNGSHKKYQHKKSKKCVVVPIHSKDIGFGLSFKIQQEILTNAI